MTSLLGFLSEASGCDVSLLLLLLQAGAAKCIAPHVNLKQAAWSECSRCVWRPSASSRRQTTEYDIKIFAANIVGELESVVGGSFEPRWTPGLVAADASLTILLSISGDPGAELATACAWIRASWRWRCWSS